MGTEAPDAKKGRAMATKSSIGLSAQIDYPEASIVINVPPVSYPKGVGQRLMYALRAITGRPMSTGPSIEIRDCTIRGAETGIKITDAVKDVVMTRLRFLPDEERGATAPRPHWWRPFFMSRKDSLIPPYG